MKKLFALFLLSVGPMLAQDRKVEIAIDSLSSAEVGKERHFRLSFHIANLSDKEISFFLKPDHLVPVVSSSMSLAPHYKLYMNGKSVDVSSVFTTADVVGATLADDYRRRDSLRTVYDREPEKWMIAQSEEFLSNLIRLKPKEKLTYQLVMAWDFERYQKQDEHEYFLEPEAKYELELSMHLMFDEKRQLLLAEDYEKLRKNPTLVKGWFTSNRVVIDLSAQKTKGQ